MTKLSVRFLLRFFTIDTNDDDSFEKLNNFLYKNLCLIQKITNLFRRTRIHLIQNNMGIPVPELSDFRYHLKQRTRDVWQWSMIFKLRYENRPLNDLMFVSFIENTKSAIMLREVKLQYSREHDIIRSVVEDQQFSYIPLYSATKSILSIPSIIKVFHWYNTQIVLAIS